MRLFQKHAFHFPLEHEGKLAEHLTALNTTISERVRLLLLADIEHPAPAIAPDAEPAETVTLTFG